MSIFNIIKFFFGRLYYANIIKKYDANAPLYKISCNNELNLNGHKNYKDIDKENVSILRNYLQNNQQQIINDKPIAKIFNLIFDEIFPDVENYLGSEARLEFAQVQETSDKNKDSVSGSWHTDSVGFRLKCYICLEGDGTQPTLILKNQKNKIYKPSFFEELRFTGLRNLNKKNDQVYLRHKTGSVYMFDTNYLHRGGYENSTSSRTVIVFEFANYKKSDELLKKSFINVPIGKQNAPIKFGKIFLDNFKYNKFVRDYLKFY